MTFPWKTFKIDLDSFKLFLDNNCPNTDGIICNNDHFIVVEKTHLTADEVNSIQNYYNSLTEENELQKINRPIILSQAILNCKNQLLTKSYKDMTVIERKLLLSLTLTIEEENEVLITYG